MKRTQIGENRTGATKHRNQAKTKIILFNQAKQIVSKIVSIDNLKEFEKDFIAYLHKRLDENSSGSFSSLSIEKIFSLHDIESRRLQNIQNKYKELEHIKLINNFTEASPIDTSIYAETKEELERFKQFQILKEAETKLVKSGVKVNYYNLTRAIYPLAELDGMSLKPNVHYIKTGRQTH
jgi:hypothetical protein